MAEKVYKGRDNTIDVILKSNSSAVDLSGVTAMHLRVGKVLLVSTNSTAHCITWNKSGYDTGETKIKLGIISSSQHADSSLIVKGHYDCNLSVYDSTNTNGVSWGSFGINIIPDIESTV